MRLQMLAVLVVAACSPPPEDPGTGGGGATGGGRAGGSATGGGTAGGTATGGGTGGSGGSGGSAGSGGGGPVSCANFADTPATACGSPDTPGAICRTRQCQPCTDPTDDARCATAYGPGHLCEAGACVRGACRTNADCGGQLCLLPARVCTRCSSDVQCGAGNLCNTATGACQGNACANPNAACAANPNDFCCGATCLRGNCCTSAQCGMGQTCIANTCTTCAAPAGNTVCVDPAAGSDVTGTGATGCCFKTLTRAIESLLAAGDGGVRVLALSGDVPATAAESFPLRLPANVSVASDVSGTPRALAVAPGAYGFELALPGSSLTDLVLHDGGGGVRVLGTSNFAANQLTRLTVRDMSHDGVRVEVGSVAIDGRFERNLNGLRVQAGNARAVSGEAHFDRNRQHGIYADRNASVVLYGTDAGSLTASGNGGSGLMLLSTQGTPAPVARVEGLFAVGNTLDGMRVGDNSNFSTVNGCVLLGNGRSGLAVREWSGVGTGLVFNGTPRPNVFQSSGAGANALAGICVEPQASTLSIDARAAVFGTRDCSLAASAGLEVSRSRTCSGGVDIGGVRQPDGGGPATIQVRLTPCQDL